MWRLYSAFKTTEVKTTYLILALLLGSSETSNTGFDVMLTGGQTKFGFCASGFNQYHKQAL